MIERIFVFIFGSVVGSFLNVCIHRMPLGESIVWPHSHCPHCKKKIRTYDNIPFISYLLLRGRCRFCRGKISLRYPLVELLTAFSFIALFERFGLSYNFFIFSLFICGLIIATFVDIQYRIIPDEISLGGIVFGLILTAVKGVNIKPFFFNPAPALGSISGIIAGGGIIYLTGKAFDLVYFKLLRKPPIQGETESMGGGDVKLLAMIGAFLGWQKAVFVFFAAPFFGAIVGIINLAVKKDHTIPYGPFLSLAAVFALFWMGKVIRLIFPYY
ncbi:MAG: prepilin peptidase [Candidatus Omnitrophica bacterium]|nr:prepilin peptidase [Candidatus Omnitrophota bacterium]MDD5553639.1 prepilin peptidase [Candidatus Omnitrophota bacterium]